MKKERLNLYYSPDIANALREFAGEEQRLSETAEEIIRLGLSLKRGETVAEQSLPVISRIVRQELQAFRSDIAEDLKKSERRLGDRLAGLIVRAVKEILIARRMLYSLLGKSYGKTLADEAYEDAATKAGRDIVSKVSEEIK